MEYEKAFEITTSSLRYGKGVTHEIGMDLADLGIKKVLVLTDKNLKELPPVTAVLESLIREQIEYALYTGVHIEPTDRSLKEAIEFAAADDFQAFVAVGGGSTIDTAKAVNLYSTYPPDDFLDYVNQPIGKGLTVPGEVKPLFAIPTTAGTGSETTGVVVFDFEKIRAKTGISHRRLKPYLGIVDPDNTRTLPPMVTAFSGLDVLTHAIESYTAIPFNMRPYPQRPSLRPAYQGANHISDLWALEAMRMAAK
ncbi:MAG: iron-containing alcohol dehydrogenase, partial [Deltaproteobacteria bacterium]|nr:iron-containing alcohol dehydrogenase [Deltaproteobacteria bacterium]